VSAREYEPHDAASIWGMLSVEQLKELAQSIKENGLLSAIVLLDDKILDGRNRYAACKMAGVEPRFTILRNCSSPARYVLDANGQRRHATPDQRAAAAARARELFAKEAKERQVAGLETSRKRGGIGCHQSDGNLSRGEREASESIVQAAIATGAARGKARRAKKLMAADPEAFERVARGEQTLKAAELSAGIRQESAEPKRLVPSSSDAQPMSKRAKWFAEVRAFDERVRDACDRGRTAGEIAEELGCEKARVFQSRARMRMTRGTKAPIIGITCSVAAAAATWDGLRERWSDVRRSATPEQLAELAAAFRAVRTAATRMVHLADGEIKEGEEHE